MKKILIYVILALLLVCVGLSVALRKINADNKRLNANQSALLSDINYWSTEDGKHVAESQKLTLTVDELKKSNLALKQTIDELGIKLKRVQSVSTSDIRTEIEIRTDVKDSIVYRDSIITPIKVFNWRDAWTDVHGIIERDSVDLSVQSVDTLTTIVHRVPHKFWFIKWGCKAIKQTVVSSNPHTKITYTEYIEVK